MRTLLLHTSSHTAIYACAHILIADTAAMCVCARIQAAPLHCDTQAIVLLLHMCDALLVLLLHMCSHTACVRAYRRRLCIADALLVLLPHMCDKLLVLLPHMCDTLLVLLPHMCDKLPVLCAHYRRRLCSATRSSYYYYMCVLILLLCVCARAYRRRLCSATSPSYYCYICVLILRVCAHTGGASAVRQAPHQAVPLGLRQLSGTSPSRAAGLRAERGGGSAVLVCGGLSPALR
jgi:hypothetical protein